MVVLGLGNPGPRYRRTRHNAGFLVIDVLADMVGVKLRRAWFRPYVYARWQGHYLVQPSTYMNRSGEVLPGLLRRARCRADGVLVVHDNVDLPPGAIKAKSQGTGGGGHRGLESIQAVLGTTAFRRVAVGVGRPRGGTLADHVLSEPDAQEAAHFDSGVRSAALAVLETLRSTHAAAPP